MYAYYCLMPKNIFEEKKEIKYMYRENTERNGDSGWRFFTGDEDVIDDLINNKKSIYDIEGIEMYDLFEILRNKEIFPSDDNAEFFMEDEPYGCVYKKINGKWEFINIDNTPEEERVYFDDA